MIANPIRHDDLDAKFLDFSHVLASSDFDDNDNEGSSNLFFVCCEY